MAIVKMKRKKEKKEKERGKIIRHLSSGWPINHFVNSNAIQAIKLYCVLLRGLGKHITSFQV